MRSPLPVEFIHTDTGFAHAIALLEFALVVISGFFCGVVNAPTCIRHSHGDTLNTNPRWDIVPAITTLKQFPCREPEYASLAN